jgi:hypothetical protein
MQPGVFDATEEETAVLRGLREDGVVVEMEEKGSRLVESNGACIKLGTNPAVNAMHGSINAAGMEDFVPVLPESRRDLPDPADQFGCPEAGREGRTLAAGMKIGVLLLGGSPFGAWETFQKCLPAEGRLFTKCILDGALRVKGWGWEVVTPSVQGGEDRPGHGGIAGAVEVPSELPEGSLPDGGHFGSGAMGDVLGGFVGAGTSRALGRVPGFDLVHLVADAAETGSMLYLEPVGGQGGGTGSMFLVVPVDHGCIPSTKALFLLPVREGTWDRGDLKEDRGERRADLGLVEPDEPWLGLHQPGPLAGQGGAFQLVSEGLCIAIHFAVELHVTVQGVPIGGVILVSELQYGAGSSRWGIGSSKRGWLP